MAMEKILKKGGLILFGLFLAICMVEIVLRIAGFNLGGLDPLYYFKADPKAGFDISENYPAYNRQFEGINIKYWSNNIGCFDEDYKDEDQFVALVGDSFTWGYAPLDQKWGTAIERYTGTRVLKCGVPAYSTAQEVLKLSNTLAKVRKNPQLIVVGYFYNDAAEDYLFPNTTVIDGRIVTTKLIENIETGSILTHSDEELKNMNENFKKYCRPFVPGFPAAMRITCFLKNNFVIYTAFQTALKNVLTKLGGMGILNWASADPNIAMQQTSYLSFAVTSTYPWLPTMWQKHFDNFASFKRLADTAHAKLMFVLIPEREMVYPELQEAERKSVPYPLDFEEPRQMVKSALDTAGIAYIDLLPPLTDYAKTASPSGGKNSDDLYWHVDPHLNLNGNKLVGILVSKYVLEHDFLPITPEQKTTRLQEVETALQGFK
jgi:hypothetical protein